MWGVGGRGDVGEGACVMMPEEGLQAGGGGGEGWHVLQVDGTAVTAEGGL